ncbi:MAG: phosphotransferase, partial [Casimicrobium sp.]
MKRIDLPDPGQDARLDEVVAWLKALPKSKWSAIASASEDASFRRYFRVSDDENHSAVVMDAPPALENTSHFVTVLRLLEGGGINVPKLMASDASNGFLLLGDLGRTTYLSALNAMSEHDANSRNVLFHDAI